MRPVDQAMAFGPVPAGSMKPRLAAKAAGMTCIAFANPDYVAQDLKEADRVVTGFAGLTVADCRQLMAAD